MRRLRFVAILLPIALVAFLIGPPQTQSQPPDRGRGFDRMGGGGGGWGGRGMSRDPEAIFETMSGGRGSVRIADLQWGREYAEEWARSKGITNGQFTKDQFLAYSDAAADRMAEDMFTRMAQGRDTLRIADMQWGRDRLEQYAKDKGLTSGTLTREQYLEYSREQRVARRKEAAADPSGQSGREGRGRGGWDRPLSEAELNRFAEESFRRADRDQDGYLSYDEMSESLQAEKDKWDTNKDGQIDLAEYKEYFKAFHEKRMQERKEREQSSGEGRGGQQSGSHGDDPPVIDLDKKVTVLRAGKLGDKMPAWFTQHDLDKDAQIPLYEWKEAGGTISEFRERDLNADGIITAEEALRYEALVKAKRGSSGETAGNDRRGGGDNRMASAGGAGGDRPGMGNFPRRGGATDSGSRGMGMGRGMRGIGGVDFNNPDSMFDFYARDRSTFNASESQRYGAALADFLKKKGITDGVVTRELFKEFWAQRPTDTGGGGMRSMFPGGNRGGGRRGGR